MGLTIHYDLALKSQSVAQARKVVERRRHHPR